MANLRKRTEFLNKLLNVIYHMTAFIIVRDTVIIIEGL